jgi:hypothetical protein
MFGRYVISLSVPRAAIQKNSFITGMRRQTETDSQRRTPCAQELSAAVSLCADRARLPAHHRFDPSRLANTGPVASRSLHAVWRPAADIDDAVESQARLASCAGAHADNDLGWKLSVGAHARDGRDDDSRPSLYGPVARDFTTRANGRSRQV